MRSNNKSTLTQLANEHYKIANVMFYVNVMYDR